MNSQANTNSRVRAKRTLQDQNSRSSRSASPIHLSTEQKTINQSINQTYIQIFSSVGGRLKYREIS